MAIIDKLNNRILRKKKILLGLIPLVFLFMFIGVSASLGVNPSEVQVEYTKGGDQPNNILLTFSQTDLRFCY